MVVLSPMKQSISINRADLRLETIWDQYSEQLLAFIRSRVADEYASEDLLQEVFLRIHLNLCCLRDLSKLESWVYQITRNAIIDHYRSRIDTLELHENLPAESDFEEEDAESELAPSLKELIDELPEAYREALVLTEYQGLSQKELAQRVGISLPGAKSRVQRARQMIRDMLLNCCHFELDRRGRIIDYHALCCCCNPA
ncbi:MAG: sigZ [Chloroflexi bacterium]|nr:sigZ [Chloroflexota bacterium]